MPIIGIYFGMRRPCGTILGFSKAYRIGETGADVGVRQGDITALLLPPRSHRHKETLRSNILDRNCFLTCTPDCYGLLNGVLLCSGQI